jgi:hypothetical protein
VGRSREAITLTRWVKSGEMNAAAHESDADRRRHRRDLLASERNAEALYARLAEADSGERREIFEELAGIEHRHAAHWEAKLRSGAEVPPPGRAQPAHQTPERSREAAVDADGPADDRARRARRRRGLRPRPRRRAGYGRGRAPAHPHPGQAAPGGKPDPRKQISHREGWHRGDRSGALRAGVLGVSDGLVSNTALVMGFAARTRPRTRA